MGAKSPGGGTRGRLLDLLRRCADAGLVSETQMTAGFSRTALALDDDRLDAPDAPATFDGVVERARAEGWLDPHFTSEGAIEGARMERRAAAEGGAEARYKRGAAAAAAALLAPDAGVEGSVGAGLCLGKVGRRAPDAPTAPLLDADTLADAAARVEALGDASFRRHFVARLVSTALERTPAARECASRLLAALSAPPAPDSNAAHALVERGCVVPAPTLPEAAVRGGFETLLSSLDDIALDCPDAPSDLALFLARAVVDDVLPPTFFRRSLTLLPDGAAGVGCVDDAAAHLAASGAAQRLERCWGFGDAA